MKQPSDPVCTWKDCVGPAMYPGDEGWPVYVRGLNTPPRAAIQRQAASEMGVDFGYVRVLARWGRIYTRQEVWDSDGGESWLDHWLSDNGVGYYFLERMYYYDAEYELPAAQRRDPKVPEIPKQPPSDWEPDEGAPCWTLCRREDAGATAIYVVETM